jgi:hypothetical protein
MQRAWTFLQQPHRQSSSFRGRSQARRSLKRSGHEPILLRCCADCTGSGSEVGSCAAQRSIPAAAHRVLGQHICHQNNIHSNGQSLPVQTERAPCPECTSIWLAVSMLSTQAHPRRSSGLSLSATQESEVTAHLECLLPLVAPRSSPCPLLELEGSECTPGGLRW